MTVTHDQLLAALERIHASLEARDAEAVAALVEAFAAQVQRSEAAGDAPKLMAMVRACEEKAQALLQELQRELTGHAASARAAAAYGGGR